MPEALVPTTDGRLVDPGLMRLSEIIQDYDPWLELRWIPPEQRTREDRAPYCVVDARDGKKEYIVFHFTEIEASNPADILARVFQADMQQGDILDRMEARNTAAKLMEMKEHMDTEDLKKDFAAFLMKTKKNYIRTDNPITGEKGIKFDDQLRRI
jgi:hypothetical protein